MRLNIDLTQSVVRNVFFISDFHLFHNNVIRFDNRPFSDVFEMHNEIEKGWNEVVGSDDIVIYLGDLSFARDKDHKQVVDFINRLNGTIHYVLGNHDKIEYIRGLNRFKTIQDYLEVRIKHLQNQKLVETLFCCMHYPIYSWNKAHHGSICVHGHCHGNLHHGEDASFYDNRRVIDAGCMLHNYRPISYSDIIEKLSHIEVNKITRKIE